PRQVAAPFPYTTLFRSGEACEDHLLELLELRAHRGVDAGIRVPEEIHPPGADGIEVALALVILEPRALAAAHGDRRQLLVDYEGDRKSTRLNSSHVSIS